MITKVFRIGVTISSFFCLVLFGCSQIDGDRKTGNYSIEGIVTDSDGTPLSSVEVSVSGVGSDESSADGTYSISGVGSGTFKISAKKSGYVLVPAFEKTGESTVGAYINVGQVAEKGIVKGVNFIARQADALRISDVQGSGATSPLTGETVTLTGVVTMVCHKAPHWYYDNEGVDGSNIPQYTSEDGFYLEALPADKDYSGKKSNGIFIDTHDSAYDASSWKAGIPTDLEAGDVVTVTGKVVETRKQDRYGSSNGLLTRTCLEADSVYHVTENGANKTAPYPDGVLLTYSEARASDWKSTHSFTDGGVTYEGEARVLAYDSDSLTPMQDAIDVLESVENMVIVIKEPRVVGGTYYNLTGVLADDGKDASGNHFRTYNETWQGDVIQMNDKTNVQDFNEELLFVDYQATDYKTFAQNLAQIGDVLVDSTGAKIFRGVMDYTGDGQYLAHPLNTKIGYYLKTGSAVGYLAPYYTRDDETDSSLTSVSGAAMPNQGWNYNPDDSWYSDTVLKPLMIDQSSASENSTNIIQYRSGTKTDASFDALEIFTPAWKEQTSTSTGSTEQNVLTIGSFNLENYEAQGGSNGKQGEVALTIKNNMLYPDIVVVVEMGDDVATPQIYANGDNSWAYKDGSVSAVKNYCGIIDAIKNAQNGPQYDFRQIDPKEQIGGGKAGVNIRTGLMFNTEKIEAVDTGIVTNTYLNTHGGDYSGTFLDSSEWPLQAPGVTADALTEVSANVYMGEDGKVHLTQSPCNILDSSFDNSRKPVVAEFKSKASGENFFVIACHLGSKRSDYPLYGQVQPPLLLSEANRNRQAQAINNFVKRILALDKNSKVIVAGDMNDFAYSTPLRVLTGQQGSNPNQILWSVEETFMPKTEQFSYAFEGNLQEIDHIFVTKSLFEAAGNAVIANALNQESAWNNVVFIPHIDSMFTRNNHYNLSDHDPVVLRIPGVFNAN